MEDADGKASLRRKVVGDGVKPGATVMFDFAKRGPIRSHHYRSYFEAQPSSNTKCAYCGRVIRFCYAMHDQHEKTFVIGSCDFHHYKGTENYKCLKAAQVLARDDDSARLGENSGKEKAKC